MPKIVNQFLGTKFKVIGGYAEGAGQTLALERGEVDGICGLSYSTLKASRPDWFRDGKLNIILQIGLEKLKDLPNVPSAIDLVSDPDSRKVLELILIRQEMGRPFAVTPGTPPDRVTILRQAFAETLKDPMVSCRGRETAIGNRSAHRAADRGAAEDRLQRTQTDRRARRAIRALIVTRRRGVRGAQ